MIASMLHTQMQAPPGYIELCAKLQTERNPAKFRTLVDKINRLLREHEKLAGPESAMHQPASRLSLDVVVSGSAAS